MGFTTSGPPSETQDSQSYWRARTKSTTELTGADQCATFLYLLNVGQCQSLDLDEARTTEERYPSKNAGL